MVLHMNIRIYRGGLLLVLLSLWNVAYAGTSGCTEVFWNASSLVDTQPDRAIDLLNGLANQNDKCALERLYGIYEFGIGVPANPSLAIYWLKHGAEIGIANMQYIFGRKLTEGNNIEKNFDEGIRWIRLAADQGHDDAIWYLNARQRGYHQNHRE